MTREEAARVMKHKLSIAIERKMHVILSWPEADTVILALEGKAEDGLISRKERSESHGKDKGAQHPGD